MCGVERGCSLHGLVNVIMATTRLIFLRRMFHGNMYHITTNLSSAKSRILRYVDTQLRFIPQSFVIKSNCKVFTITYTTFKGVEVPSPNQSTSTG